MTAKPTLLLYPGAGTGCDHSSLIETVRGIGYRFRDTAAELAQASPL